MNLRNLWLGLACLCLALLGAAPATAHDVLVNVDPSDGEVLERAPEEVVLTFSGELIDISPQVILTEGEERIETEPPIVDRFDLVAPLPELGDGQYTLAYSVVSSDGHRIEGSTTFVVGEATLSGETTGATGGEAATSGGDGTTGDGGASEDPGPSATGDSARGVNPGETGGGDESSAVTTIRILGFVMLALGTVIIVSRIIRRRR